MKIIYMLYDGRYRANPDRETCYEVCDSEIEAKDTASEYGEDTVIVKAKINGKIINNSQIIN
jgi:hypothetical protein